MTSPFNCAACGADKSHWESDVDQPTMLFCNRCGNVVQECEIRDVANKDAFDHKNATGWTLFIPHSKAFHFHSKTCRELRLLAPRLQLTDRDLSAGYDYLRRYTREARPVSSGVTANALAYFLRKMTQRPIFLRTCAAINGQSFIQVGREYKRLIAVIKPDIPEATWDPFMHLYDTAVTVYDSLCPYRNKAPPPFSLEAVVALAGRIFNVAKTDSYHTGRFAIPILVACIMLASDVLNLHKVAKRQLISRMKELAVKTGVATRSISLRYAELVELFRHKANELPWNSKGPQCENPILVIEDILNFEDTKSASKSTNYVATTNDMHEHQDSAASRSDNQTTAKTEGCLVRL